MSGMRRRRPKRCESIACEFNEVKEVNRDRDLNRVGLSFDS